MIRKKTIESDYTHRHLEDVYKLRDVISRNGYECDLNDAANLWEEYSEARFAGWLGFPDSEKELWNILEPLVKSELVESLFEEIRKYLK